MFLQQVVVKGEGTSSSSRKMLHGANGALMNSGGGGRHLDAAEGLPLPPVRVVDNRRHECVYCGKKFPTPSKLNRHELIHTGEKPYVCHLCMKGFTQLAHLKNHLRFSHRPPNAEQINLETPNYEQIHMERASFEEQQNME